MVFQNYALMPHMTIFENIAFPLRVRRLPEAEIRKRVAEVLELVQLPGVMSRRPRELSGGQQQRVALARCIVYNPALILMDEPLGALDRNLRGQMQFEIKHLHKRLGMTVLYVTHDQEEALGMSDSIVLLNQGAIEQVGEPADLYFRPCSVFTATFLGDSNLLQARVIRAGMSTEVALATGQHVFSSNPSIAEAGQEVSLLVRPENVVLVRDDEAGRFVNRIKGAVIESSMLGGITKYYIKLADGTIIMALERTKIGQALREPGSVIMLGWSDADSLVLPVKGKLASQSTAVAKASPGNR